ncbi:DUF262 domain-containing protein [Gimesia algae]|uniref:DUF262 domain-containing protein n=1 Tax=Gimesia algae TaxID=2527971 RepID=A0A517VAX7_9PLAN|nr:DUF262 domain-containing protein [Gimesia algae]QDT90165.1 hypothetical protein Pan161_18150 [Gimesia algae]
MKADSMPFSKIISIDQGAREHYHVPKYQREYSWRKTDWERLVQDIDENESGYFMGSIICVNDGERGNQPGSEIVYDVVDGQQRLTTLSLFMMAIYERLNDLKNETEFEDDEDRQDYDNSLSSLRNKLVKKKKKDGDTGSEIGGWVEQSKICFLRVQPSSQNRNLDDYTYLLSKTGIIKKRDKPKYFGLRSIAKAYRFFQNWISEDPAPLMALVEKINQLNFVHISVNSQADAFTLFETLNNRGVPLSAIDIIKNKILSEMEKQHQVDVDESFEKWQEVIAAIPDTTDQERFLRHYYNAFRWDKSIRVEGISRAIKSKIILIYEKLIKQDAAKVFDDICIYAEIYGKLIAPSDENYDSVLTKQLSDLSRINASPAYQILLYLFHLPDSQLDQKTFRSDAVDLLQKYYVRRNVTDFPGTRDLDQASMNLIEACHNQIESGHLLTFDYFRDTLLKSGTFASRDQFEKNLRKSMYSTNHLMTRYLLIKLDETHHSREYAPDLWARNDKDNYVWTVEHILPQKEDISNDWVDMIANGDRAKAQLIHEENVHRLGNLTMSGYNSKLATASFQDKQALAENKKFLGHKINIGYRNGLALNNLNFTVSKKSDNLANVPKWTMDMIESRTNVMVDQLLKMYSFEGIE